MFTGIVEELGRVESFDNGRLRINASTVLEDARLGDSIAVSEFCLTVVAHGDGWWEADVSTETIARTSLARHVVGDPVNLERAVRMQDRLGGHLVQGHVDAVGEIVEPVPDLRVRVPAELLPYLVEKGSVTVDGVSLTVVTPLDDGFTVAIAGTEGTEVELAADPVRLGQVVTNLLTNAVRHTPRGGTVTITVAAADETVAVIVADTGSGINGDPERIFDRFSRSADSGGSGLGLTIARQLVERHGGNLTAANAATGGARFTVTLPRVS